MLRIAFIMLVCVGCNSALAQLPYQLAGARAAGLGGATVALPDLWALHYNIAGLAEVQELSLAAGTQTRFNLPELSTAGILGAAPLLHGVLGASFTRYGFGPYSLQEASVGYAHKIALVAVGLQGGFVQVATDGFGSRIVPVLSAGGIADLHPNLSFGGFAYNITQSVLNKETAEYLPTILRAGLLWKPVANIRLLLETEKDVDEAARLKTGLEYQVREFLQLRTGISTQPLSLHGGLGFVKSKFRFDYALQHHRYIGLMHHLSFGLRFTKDK